MQRQNDYYLSIMGIQSWHPRAESGEPALVCSQLLRSHSPIGLLLVDQKSELGQESDKAKQLITAILQAVGLIEAPYRDTVRSLETISPAEVQIVIAMGDNAHAVASKLSHITNKVMLPHPNQILATPLTKRAVWEKLQTLRRPAA